MRLLLSVIVVFACHRTLFADKLLVLDSRVIESAENARLMPGTVTKHERNPLFQADKPWENSMNNLYPNVIWDDAEKVFKMWYKCVLADNDAIRKMAPRRMASSGKSPRWVCMPLAARRTPTSWRVTVRTWAFSKTCTMPIPHAATKW
jgi:hypothetical protein